MSYPEAMKEKMFSENPKRRYRAWNISWKKKLPIFFAENLHWRIWSRRRDTDSLC